MNIENLMMESSRAFQKAALNENAKSYILENKVLFNLLEKAAGRYIAGKQLTNAVNKVIELNTRKIPCTVDFMGESIRNSEEAIKVTKEFLNLAREINHSNLNCTISLDLSHIGLAIDKQLAIDNLHKICEEGLEVIISAENVDRTDIVLETYFETSAHYKNLGITLQAYLHRSENDFQELIKHEGKIRIVKGAFETPRGIALDRGEELNNKYLDFVKLLLEKKHKCSIATHDPKIQDGVIDLLKNIEAPKNYEFESLLGIQNKRLFKLSREHPARIYIVYGTEWYLYLCNRLAEYPPGIFQAVIDVMK